MMIHHLMRAVLALAVGVVLLMAPSAQAATVPAATILAGCPGPIFIDTDTTLTGSAKVTGDCTLATPIGVAVGPQINLSKATLSFTGSFEILGNAASMMVDRSKITTGLDLTLDSLGPMTIRGSRLTANGGSVTLPPRDNLAITGSSVAAQGNVTLGGPGGRRDVTDSALAADGQIIIAPGAFSAPSSISVVRSRLSSTGNLNLGGFLMPDGDGPALSVDQSTLEALGEGAMVSIAPGGAFVTRALVISNGTTVRAPAGWISLAGTHLTSIEDSRFSSAADQFGRGMLLGGAVSPSCRGSEFRTKQGGIVVTGGGAAPVFEDCQFLAGGQFSFAPFPAGILIGTASSPSITGSLFQATGGGIAIFTRGPLSITASSLWARHAAGIAIGTSGDRSIWDSELNSPLGPIAIRGDGPMEIEGSTLTAMNAAGILLSGGTSAVDSSLLFTRGPLTIQNFGSAVAASTLKADAGLLTETSGGGNSLLTGSEVRAASIIVRSFDDTTVTNNYLPAASYEFSAAGTCTSSGNLPNIPCF